MCSNINCAFDISLHVFNELYKDQINTFYYVMDRCKVKENILLYKSWVIEKKSNYLLNILPDQIVYHILCILFGNIDIYRKVKLYMGYNICPDIDSVNKRFYIISLLHDDNTYIINRKKYNCSAIMPIFVRLHL